MYTPPIQLVSFEDNTNSPQFLYTGLTLQLAIVAIYY